MLKRGRLYLIFSYAFFLAWLLSFLYNGPAIDILFSGREINSGILALAYIVAPAIMLLGIGFMDVDRKWKNLFLRSGLLVCLFGTMGILIMGDNINPLISYIFAGILGIYSVLFITGWGCYFVELLEVKMMWKAMGIVICLGNVIFNFNSIFKAFSLNTLIIIVLFICLLVALYNTESLIRKAASIPKSFGIKLEPKVLWMMCIFVFLLNLGGGILHTLIGPMARAFYSNIHVIDLTIYLLLGIIIVLMRKKLELETTLTISIILIACGYLFIILVSGNPIPGYILTVVGYAIFDIMIWTLVGELGYVFGKPVKIFAYVMSANLFAVFGGNVMGSLLSETREHIYIAILITAISILIGFGFLTRLVRSIYSYMDIMEGIIKARDSKECLVSEERAERVLSATELKIFNMMITNMKNSEIIEMLKITNNEMKVYSKDIYEKFGVANKKELIKSAKQKANIQLEDAVVLRDHKIFDSLTNREVEVCHLISEGKSYVEISSELYISQNTVKTHVRRVYSKLGISSRKELIALINGLV